MHAASAACSRERRRDRNHQLLAAGRYSQPSLGRARWRASSQCHAARSGAPRLLILSKRGRSSPHEWFASPETAEKHTGHIEPSTMSGGAAHPLVTIDDLDDVQLFKSGRYVCALEEGRLMGLRNRNKRSRAQPLQQRILLPPAPAAMCDPQPRSLAAFRPRDTRDPYPAARLPWRDPSGQRVCLERARSAAVGVVPRQSIAPAQSDG